MIWGQYLIYDQNSFEALWSSQNISIKFFILSILSLSEELIFLLYASIFKSFREHDKRIQYYKQNIIFLEGRTSYPLPSSLCFLTFSVFLSFFCEECATQGLTLQFNLALQLVNFLFLPSWGTAILWSKVFWKHILGTH